MSPPLYRFCWWCSRQLHGAGHRVVEFDGQDVRVHARCVDEMLKDGRGVSLIRCDEGRAAMTSMRMAARALLQQLRAGCGDNSCPFGPKGGMGTNGGCRCHEAIEEALQAARDEAIEAAAVAVETEGVACAGLGDDRGYSACHYAARRVRALRRKGEPR